MKKNGMRVIFLLSVVFFSVNAAACRSMQVKSVKNMQTALLEKYPHHSTLYHSNDDWQKRQRELKEQIILSDPSNLKTYTLHCTGIFLLKYGMWYSGTLHFSLDDFQLDLFAAAFRHPAFRQTPDTAEQQYIVEASARLIQTMTRRPSSLLPEGGNKISTNILGEINSATTISWYRQFQDALTHFAEATQDPVITEYTQKAVLLLELCKKIYRYSSIDLKNLQKIEPEFQQLLKELQTLLENESAYPRQQSIHFKILSFTGDVFYQKVRKTLLAEQENILQRAEKNYAYLKQLDTINHLPEGSFKLAELQIVS